MLLCGTLMAQHQTGEESGKAICDVFRDYHRQGLDPDTIYGETCKEQLKIIKVYAKEQVGKEKKNKYWLEIVYVEHISLETAKMLAELTADKQFLKSTEYWIQNSDEYKEYGESYLRRIKQTRKPIAVLVRYKKKKFSLCVVYTYGLVWK